nr:protease inhibitor I42 family protein [Herpetosiphonaceae bacterium]
MKIRNYITLFMTIIILAACGGQEGLFPPTSLSGAQGNQNGEIPIPLNQEGTPLAVTSAALSPDHMNVYDGAKQPPGPTALPVNEAPVIQSNTVTISIDAYWGSGHKAIELRVGQTLIVELPSHPNAAAPLWQAHYESSILSLDPTMTIEAPAPQGWTWQALSKGETTIKLSENRAPCPSMTCDGGPPPRNPAQIPVIV